MPEAVVPLRDESDVYDRQIRLWGAEAQVRSKNCSANDGIDTTRGSPSRYVLRPRFPKQKCSTFI